MWEISKDLLFCYGHRVHSQKLDSEYSLTSDCQCKHMHGHQATVSVTLQGNSLNEQSMVTDFTHLNWLKEFLDNHLDHKFIVDYYDPLFNTIVGVNNENLIPVTLPGSQYKRPVGWEVDTGALWQTDEEDDQNVLDEYYESFFIVDFCPTSEKLAEWVAEITQEKMGSLARVHCVTWHETPKSKAVYYRP